MGKIDKNLVINPLRRPKPKDEDDDPLPSTSGQVMLPSQSTVNHIKCKALRHKKLEDLKREKKKEKKERKRARLESDAPKQVPKTIESMRIQDETMIQGSLSDENNEEVKEDIENDEFAAYYSKQVEPKVLITYADNPHKKSRIFGRELQRMIPNSLSKYRNRSGIKKMVKSAIARQFTAIIVINEDQCKPNGILLIHLPEGPTMHFKLTSVKITKDLKRSHKEITEHRPEVVLNNFTTRLGVTISRGLGALFHYDPEYKGRRVVTFHNQRDYIFFRHHRYEFNLKTGKARLRELGPRFTLKLRSVQDGTFDSKYGNYIWTLEGNRHRLESSRRKFFL